MCPPFNLVFEETPHKFLYQERKTSLGEGCLSKWTDQMEWGRDRRTQTESSLAWTVKYMLFRLFYFANFLLHSGRVAAPSAVSLSFMNRHSAWHFSDFPSQLLPVFPPRELHPFACSPSSIHRSLHFCAPVSMYSVAYRHAWFSHAASALASLLRHRHVRARYVTRVVETSVYGPSSSPRMLLHRGVKSMSACMLDCCCFLWLAIVQASHI